MKIVKYLFKIKRANYRRFLKFSMVGAASTVVDFALLNILSVSSGINRGIYAALFSVISFLVANFNSYHMNKRWTFRSCGMNSKYRKYLKLSFVGVAANLIFVYLLTELFQQSAFSDIIWLNISKLAATVLAASINYYNYKNRVFINPQINEQTV